MSYAIKELSYPPVTKLQLPGTLDPTFEESGRAEHDRVWKPLEAYGIMPCGNGVQVYAQPSTRTQIQRLSIVLRLVAARLPRRK